MRHFRNSRTLLLLMIRRHNLRPALEDLVSVVVTDLNLHLNGGISQIASKARLRTNIEGGGCDDLFQQRS